MTAADTFREIDAQAADVRRKLDEEGYTRAACGDLFSIQRLAQNGLAEALANQPKLAAFDGLRAVAQKTAAWLERLAEQAERQAQQANQFETLVEACTADAKNYRAVARDLQAEIVKAQE